MGQQSSKNKEKLQRKDALSQLEEGKRAKNAKKVGLHNKLHNRLLGGNNRAGAQGAETSSRIANGYYSPEAQSRRKFLGSLGFSKTPETVGKRKYMQGQQQRGTNDFRRSELERSKSIDMIEHSDMGALYAS